MTNMKLLATLLAVFGTLHAHAQGLIWSVRPTAQVVGAAQGGGAPENRQVAFDHVSNPLFPTTPSLNPVSGIFSMTIATNNGGFTFFANSLNAPGFAGFVAGLTDGANDYIRISDFSSSFYVFATEGEVLGRPPATPDFAGYTRQDR